MSNYTVIEGMLPPDQAADELVYYATLIANGIKHHDSSFFELQASGVSALLKLLAQYVQQDRAVPAGQACATINDTALLAAAKDGSEAAAAARARGEIIWMMNEGSSDRLQQAYAMGWNQEWALKANCRGVMRPIPSSGTNDKLDERP